MFWLNVQEMDRHWEGRGWRRKFWMIGQIQAKTSNVAAVKFEFGAGHVAV